MTRKHFIKIAKILNDNDASEDMILSFSSMLVETNPRFDHHKFIVASGYYGGK
jgi:hypothetical protein|tara:strand:+ start:421 stop:579 length:159 start_codon:yes stop_codon:yes gene_type:complete